MKEVQLVKGGWSCDAGYVWWAYVCELDVNHTRYGGKKLFEPDNSRPDNDVMSPVSSCEKWCKENGYKIVRRTEGMTS